MRLPNSESSARRVLLHAAWRAGELGRRAAPSRPDPETLQLCAGFSDRRPPRTAHPGQHRRTLV